MSTPDHVENTGDNLRHAAEIQEQAQEEEQKPEGTAAEPPLPDFNT